MKILFPSTPEGLDDLLWSLLQYISGSISKNTAAEFSPVLRILSLYEFEYSPSPLPLPDLTDPACVKRLTPASIFILLARKSEQEKASTGAKVGQTVALCQSMRIFSDAALIDHSWNSILSLEWKIVDKH